MPPRPVSSTRSLPRRHSALVLAALCVLAAAAYLVSRREDLSQLRLAPLWLAPLALCELALLALRGSLLDRLCRALGVRLARREALGLQAGSVLANYLLPGLGGTSLRGAYLRGRHDLPLAAFGGLLAATYLLQYLILCAAGLAVSWLWPALPAAVAWVMAAALAAVTALAFLAFRAPRASPDLPVAGLRGALASAFAGWRQMRASGLGPPLLLAAAQLAGTAVALACSFAALGQTLAPAQALFAAVLSEGSILLNLTPAGLGVVEGAVGAAAGLLGIGAPLGVAAAALRRSVTLVVAAAVGGLTLGLPGRRS